MRRSPRQRYPYFPGDPDPFIRPLQGIDPPSRPAVSANAFQLPPTRSSDDIFAALQRLTSTIASATSGVPDPAPPTMSEAMPRMEPWVHDKGPALLLLSDAANDLPSFEIPERPTPSIPSEPEDNGKDLPDQRPLAPPRRVVEPGMSDQDIETGLDERLDQFRRSAEEEAAKARLERRQETAKLETNWWSTYPEYAKAVDEFDKFVAEKWASGVLPASVAVLREEFRRLMRKRFGVPDLENDDSSWEDYLTQARDANRDRISREGYKI
jgi:hypothetical protein